RRREGPLDVGLDGYHPTGGQGEELTALLSPDRETGQQHLPGADEELTAAPRVHQRAPAVLQTWQPRPLDRIDDHVAIRERRRGCPGRSVEPGGATLLPSGRCGTWVSGHEDTTGQRRPVAYTSHMRRYASSSWRVKRCGLVRVAWRMRSRSPA